MRLVGLTLVACLSVSVSSGALATAATTCRPLVTDPAGDAYERDVGPTPITQDNLDILAVDLAANSRTMTLTVRMAAVDTTPAPARLIDVILPIAGRPDDEVYDAYLYLGPDKTQFTFQDTKGHASNVPGTLIPASGLIRFHIPRTLIARNVKRFVNIEAWSSVLVGTNEVAEVLDYDSASSKRSYTIGSRGCL
jgi:hypothetical protein